MATPEASKLMHSPEEPATRAKLIHADGNGSDYGAIPDSMKEIKAAGRTYKDSGKRDGCYRIFEEVAK